MNLIQTARTTKRAVAAFIILLAVLTIGKTSWKTGIAVWQRFFPPQQPPPEVAFGKLPPQNILSIDINTSNWTYTLDTPTGRLPQTPDRLPVFPLTKVSTTPLTEQKAQNLAQTLGFTEPPQILASNKYRWSTTLKTLEMNIVSQAFSLDHNLDYLETHLPIGSAPPEQQAETEAANLLLHLDLVNSALKSGRKEAAFIRIHEGNLEKVESISQAQLTRIDFYKVISIDGKTYDVMGPEPKEGFTYALVTDNYRNLQSPVPIVEYRNWEIKTDEGSTYPILESTEAWKRLKEGQASVVYLKPQDTGPYQDPRPPTIEKVRIQKISFAYFESRKPQQYLLPVFVFEGLAEIKSQKPWEIVIYLPAVTDEWAK